MKESELRQGEKYRTESGREFILILPYKPNTECFKRISDSSLHYGREFIEYENGHRIIDLKKF